VNRTILKSARIRVLPTISLFRRYQCKNSGSGVQHLTQTIGTVQQSQVQVFSVSSDSLGVCKEDEVQARLHFDFDTLDTSRWWWGIGFWQDTIDHVALQTYKVAWVGWKKYLHPLCQFIHETTLRTN